MADHTLSQISHYQKKLEKYAATGEDEKLLYCIHKLKYLPVTVSHLERTGVGKSINSLRHKNGMIGEKARTLVQKWKLMVSQEEEQQQEEESQMEYEPDVKSLQNKYHSQSSTLPVNEEEYDPSDEGDRLQIQEPEDDEKEPELDVTYNPGGHSIENEEENCNGYNPKTSREDYLSIGAQSQYDYNPSYKNDTDAEESRPTSPRPSSLPNGDTHKESHDVASQRDSHEDSVQKDKSHKSREESKHKKKKHKSRHDSEEKHKSSEHRKSKHKSSKSKDKKNEKEKDSNKEPVKHTSHSSSSSKSKSNSTSHSKSKSESTDTTPVNSSCRVNSCSSSGSSSNPNNSFSSDLKRPRDPEDQHDSPSSKKSKINEKQKDKKLHKSSRSSKDDHKSSKRKKDAVPAPSEFEAALMGMDNTPSKKKKKKKSKEKDKKEISENESPSSSPSSPNLKELDLGYREQLPELPSSFEMETSTAPPQLMTHYKPLPHVPQRSASKDPLNNMTNEEALNYMFTSKSSSKQRRIYAGKATEMFTVPTLFDFSMRKLQDNIDLIETTGGIPYSILKPVLDKASPQQLFTLEDYNPYLLEDTDVHWAGHCRKSFKNKQREDMETWREMFIRSTDEHKKKMRSVTESLQKKYITKAPPKRTTQLAYINTAAKPPKSVARAQARYGTASLSAPPVKTSSKAAEPQSIASTSSNSAAANGSSSNAVPSRPEKTFPNKPPAVKKPKVAPLMGKARQLMKKVCRR